MWGRRKAEPEKPKGGPPLLALAVDKVKGEEINANEETLNKESPEGSDIGPTGNRNVEKNEVDDIDGELSDNELEKGPKSLEYSEVDETTDTEELDKIENNNLDSEDASEAPPGDAEGVNNTGNSILKDDLSKAHRLRYTPSPASSPEKSRTTPPSGRASKQRSRPPEGKTPPMKYSDLNKETPEWPSRQTVMQKLIQPGKKRLQKPDEKMVKPEDENEADEVKVKDEKAKETTWWELFYDYTQNATVHGIKYITDKDTYCFRKLIWMVIFLVCCAYVTYQIQERIRYFLSEPVMVKVEVNFNQSLRFPAVAICNQNAFRVTEAVRLGYTDLLDEIYNRNYSHPYTDADLVRYPRAENSIAEMYKDLAHRKEDAIIRCEWRNIPCGPENFTMEFTDQGQCLMLNIDTDKSPLMANKTGQDSGLHLVINIEQYEYMVGPHSSAGIRLMLYDRNDFPMVDELGYAVAPGSRSFVGMKVLVMERLDIPKGSCLPRSRPLETFPFYTDKACRMECLSRYLKKMCGCIAQYLPKVEGARVCSIRKYLMCAEKEEDHFERNVEELCRECLPACSNVIYNPTFSYLTSAAHDIDRILDNINQTQLLERYVRARDATHAVDKRKFLEDKDYLLQVLKQTDVVGDLLNQNLSDIATSNLGRVNTMLDFAEAIYNNISEVYRFQDFVLKYNFFIGAVEFDKNILNPLTSDFSHYMGKFERNLNYLQYLVIKRVNPKSKAHDTTNQGVPELLYNMMKNELDTKKNMTDTALEYFQKLRLAYEKAEPVLNDRYVGRTEAEHLEIAPKQDLYYSVKDIEAETTLDNLRDELRYIRRLYSRFDAILHEAFNKSAFSVQALRNTGRQHKEAVERVNQMRGIVKDQIFNKPILELEEKVEEFDNCYDKLKSQLKKMIEDVRFLNSTISTKDAVFHTMEETINMSDTYISHEGWKQFGKSELCNHLIRGDVQHHVKGLKDFVDALMTRSREVSKGWNATSKHFVSFIKTVVEDGDTFSTDKNYVKMLLHFTNSNSSNGFLHLALPVLNQGADFDNFTHEFEQDISRVHARGDISKLFGTKVFDLLKAAGRFKQRCERYLEENKLDGRFYRDNFLRIDLYFSELSYELIQQMPAYTIFDLLSDVGGSLGLFIGASVISAFELLDLFLFNYFKKRRSRNEDLSRAKAEKIYEGMI
ncbi:uncharacterized protein LOC135501567 [Lineus longissimus]|uniref:uncharacterized protein LOC135501567 n=1 Tax=Lineus longissimus TaxID=88925 RepID=UPI002B4F5659